MATRGRARSSTRRGCTTTSPTLTSSWPGARATRPRRVQAQGDRRAAAPAATRPVRRRPGRRARGLEPIRATQVRPRPTPDPDEAGTAEGTIIALDVLELEPIDGVEFVGGDFREPEVLAALEARPRRTPQVDVVLSDMAPNLSGIGAADAARMSDSSNWRSSSPGPSRVRGCGRLQTLSRQRLQPACGAIQGRVPGVKGRQTQGIAVEIGGNLSRRYRRQAARPAVGYPRVAVLCEAI